MNQENKKKFNMKKYWQYIRIFSRLSVIWIFIIIWWGFSLFSPLQLHNQIIKTDLILFGIGFFFFIILGFYKKKDDSFLKKNIFLLIPFFLLLALTFTIIFYYKDITLSLLIFTAAVLLFSYAIDFEPFKELLWLLFLTCIGIFITSAFMNSVRGRPEFGAHFFCTQISYLLNFFGLRSSSISGTLLFNGKKITCDFIKLGIFPWLALTLSFCALILASLGKKGILIVIISFVLHYFYLLLRFAGLSIFMKNTMFLGLETFNLFYWRFLIFSFSPLILLWFIIVIQADFIELINLIKVPILPQFLQKNIQKSDILASMILFLIAVFLSFNYTFPGFENRQDLHFLIDEIHSQWESTLIDFDEKITGAIAENSYHSYLDYLSHFHEVSVITDKPLSNITTLPEGVNIINAIRLTSQVLNIQKSKETKNVLILKCITTPFSEDEIKAVKDFIFNGGCAFLIGDHTDVFFMNRNINELAKNFGIMYRQNAVHYVESGWPITDLRDYRIHPITSSLDKFIWATGDTLTLISPAFPLIFSPFVCYADEANYFFESFFGNTRLDAEEVLGSFCILAGSEYGKGRIVAFTDSTCFNNYLMFTVGRRELITGINSWFGTEKVINPFPWIILLLILCLIFLKIKKRGMKYDNFLYLLLIAISLGFIIGLIISNKLKKSVYTKPESIRQMPPKVLIDSSHNPKHCLSFGRSELFSSDISYDNLIFNIGRINIFPEIIYKDRIKRNILNNSNCLIICSPQKEYTDRERKAILDFVLDGGSLLLVEGANPNSTINQIAHLFGINYRLNPYRNKVFEMKKSFSNSRGAYKINPAWVDGDETLFAFQGMPIMSYLRKGKGLIILIGDDSIFEKNNKASYLITFQCNLMNAIVNKDVEALKSINWNYLIWGSDNH